MITFIVNEASGRGRGAATWRVLRRALFAQGISFREWHTHRPGDGAALGRLASQGADELQKLVVVGGDGTVNEVLCGIRDFAHTALGVVPIGSGNDFIRGLGLPRDPEKALERVLTADGSARIDIGQVQIEGETLRRFGISAGIGMDAWVCANVDASRVKTWLGRLGLGSLTYALKTLSAAWNIETASGIAHITSPEGTYTRDLKDLIFLACMNFPWEGGGVPIAPEADARDGYFSVCLAENLTRAQVFQKLPLLALGRHVHTKGVTLVQATRVEVQLDKPMYIHADGEVPGRVRRATFEVLPEKLKVLV